MELLNIGISIDEITNIILKSMVLTMGTDRGNALKIKPPINVMSIPVYSVLLTIKFQLIISGSWPPEWPNRLIPNLARDK